MIKKLIALLLCLPVLTQAGPIDLIPAPQHLEMREGTFALNAKSKIVYQEGLQREAEFLMNALSPATGWDFELKSGSKGKKNSIYLSTDAQRISHEEGYELEINSKGIHITGHSRKGVFYGIQSLLQIFPEEIYSEKRHKVISWEVPALFICDAPHYPWRGMMLDVARYFFDVDFVKEYIDMMAMYKFNQLHLHLIDDSGWRIEIKKYPKLTEAGAFAGEGPHYLGGYYTQEELRDLVAYAEARNVNLIPEIELPAHVLSAVVAYPWLSCRNEQLELPDRHFISRDLYCVGKESTFEFLENVLDEVMDIFPSKYIHVGGDEAVYTRWEKCEHCQKRKEDLGMKHTSELQVYFTKRIQKYVEEHGRTIVGWDEIIERGLDEKAVGMVWHRPDKAIAATKAGHDVVMSLTHHAYFDFPESKTPGEMKAATWCPPIPLQKSYEWDPMIEGIDDKYANQVLGVNACLWSDQFIHGEILREFKQLDENRSEKYIQYLTLPRMSAAAEVAWTSQYKRDYMDYQKRLASHYKRYQILDYGYRVPEPKLVSKEANDKGYLITLENVVKGADIRYTTNGKHAHSKSALYTEPVQVERLEDFHAITVVSDKQYSLPVYFPGKWDKYKKLGTPMAEWKPKNVQGKAYSELNMSATGLINKNGKYQITFQWTGGNYRLDIEGIQVFRNGELIAADEHFGYAGGSHQDNTFTVNIDAYETGAAFDVVAKVRGDLGNDTNGVVLIKKVN